MNAGKIRKALLLAIGGVFVWWAWKSPAQDVSGETSSVQMPYAVSQVLELEQAKISDATVIAYIKSSGTSYNLNASQIVFLRQQGVSDAVLTAMLTQPRTGVPPVSIQSQDPPPAPQSAPMIATATGTDPAVLSAPPVTYVQTAPPSYSYSYYYPYPYYSYYGWPYGCGWYGGWAGWRGGWGWGGGWHGGWGGGYHGGYHGGWGGGGGHGGWGGGGHR